MWDLIVSVPDHCLSFYFSDERIFWYSRICSGYLETLKKMELGG